MVAVGIYSRRKCSAELPVRLYRSMKNGCMTADVARVWGRVPRVCVLGVVVVVVTVVGGCSRRSRTRTKLLEVQEECPSGKTRTDEAPRSLELEISRQTSWVTLTVGVDCVLWSNPSWLRMRIKQTAITSHSPQLWSAQHCHRLLIVMVMFLVLPATALCCTLQPQVYPTQPITQPTRCISDTSLYTLSSSASSFLSASPVGCACCRIAPS